ncbi:MAG TPA: nicotinate phosphoribosyltransferase [Euryarchaeota archaeon]|nr:nicotinate phosphoribosyltransferase [Euryarchaeota archaeon]
MKGRFNAANYEEIKSGLTSDIYFFRTVEILKRENVNPYVVAEFTMHRPPKNWPWVVFTGLDEVIELLEGINVDLYAIPEGTIVPHKDYYGVKVPVMHIQGKYADFAIYETPILGMISQATGIATKAARIKKIAGDKTVLAFGIRRMHPAIAPMIDRASYIGGCDAVSSIIGAKTIGIKPTGTMPHALILALGSPEKAWIAFDKHMPEDVPRIALADTISDEKREALRAAEILGERLYGVRLDTPSSRRGNMKDIVTEVRWELKLRGFDHVKIVVSGGLDEEEVEELRDVVDAFGVGSSISNAPAVDFAMDIVEVEGQPISKRGKIAGRKVLMKCESCKNYFVFPAGKEVTKCPVCNGQLRPLLKKYIENGRVIKEPEDPKEIRKRVLEQLKDVNLNSYP